MKETNIKGFKLFTEARKLRDVTIKYF